ncbi:MAG: hypothetical protein JRJ09_13850 [Deltaproteobacteria bacterium]|nr:hypothetical protein [Deltaproteobacteria bacterium]MBW2049592.1 hypothetical protein [Deltaproteobacteria bacterium]MBW2112018.1 hypothetical protein [Deltaproteobacteria bacterium]MBW2352011.1 hypothetical protein [Deltaproteobacteria bacterium]
MEVLIIRPGALGDTLMLAPALTDLSAGMDVTFVGREPGLWFISPLVSRALDMDRGGWHRLFTNRGDGQGLPVSEVDMAVAFLNDPDGIVRTNLKSFLPHASVHIFRSLPSTGERVHVARYAARSLKSAGLPVDPERAMRAAVKGGSLGGQYGPWGRRKSIVLHPGSGSPDKNHPPRFWIDLFGVLSGETGPGDLEYVFLLGPAEESIRPCLEGRFRNGAVRGVSCPDREGLINTLCEAAVFLGHDSGITHLSAMLGTPTVALFKKKNTAQWAPLGPRVAIVRGKEPGPGLIERAVRASRRFLGIPGRGDL